MDLVARLREISSALDEAEGRFLLTEEDEAHDGFVREALIAAGNAFPANRGLARLVACRICARHLGTDLAAHLEAEAEGTSPEALAIRVALDLADEFAGNC